MNMHIVWGFTAGAIVGGFLCLLIGFALGAVWVHPGRYGSIHWDATGKLHRLHYVVLSRWR